MQTTDLDAVRPLNDSEITEPILAPRISVFISHETSHDSSLDKNIKTKQQNIAYMTYCGAGVAVDLIVLPVR